MKKEVEYWVLRSSIPNEITLKVINEFLLTLKNMDRPKNTVLYYLNGLRSFFIDIEAPFSAITSTDIQEWLDVHQQVYKQTTISKTLSILRFFYSHCVEHGYIEQSPVPFRGNPKGKPDHYWELWRELPNSKNHRVINEFLLNEKNMNKSKNTIISYRKRLQYIFKEVDRPFNEITSHEIQNWISKYKINRKAKSISLFSLTIYTFYEFCLQKGYMDLSPIKKPRLLLNLDNYWIIQSKFLNKKNEDIINQFLLHLKVMNYSKATINNYRCTLQAFFKDQEKIFTALNSHDVLASLQLLSKGKKETTITSYLNGLSSFYNFCVEEGYLEKSLIKTRWYPRLPITIPKNIKKEEIARVRLSNEKDCLRNRVLMEFLYSTGCRIGELHTLDRTNVDIENRTAIVTGKGRKIRQVHFSEKCAWLLERYLESRIDQNPALLVTLKGRELNRLSILRMQSILTNLGEEAGLSGALHPHRFRHTFASELLEKGAELSFIADELGHAQLSTTQTYLNIPNRKIISMYQKFMG